MLTNLPNKEELLNRLKEFDSDPYMVERFYPYLLKNAGNQIAAEGVVMMLSLAIEDFVTENNLPAQIRTLRYIRMEQLIGAVVSDQEVAQAAIDFYRSAIEH